MRALFGSSVSARDQPPWRPTWRTTGATGLLQSGPGKLALLASAYFPALPASPPLRRRGARLRAKLPAGLPRSQEQQEPAATRLAPRRDLGNMARSAAMRPCWKTSAPRSASGVTRRKRPKPRLWLRPKLCSPCSRRGTKGHPCLRERYAVTLHKVQGSTLDYMALWLDKQNVRGAGYVALSRVRRDDAWCFFGRLTVQHFTPLRCQAG